MWEFFGREDVGARGENRLRSDVLTLTADHLYLVILSLGVAVLLGASPEDPALSELDGRVLDCVRSAEPGNVSTPPRS